MWLEDWKGSGKSVWKYAKANGLNPQTFTRWTKEKAEVSRRFVEIKPPLAEKAGGTPEILIEKGDVKIHIPVAMDRQYLQAVIESLGCRL
jgi:hypothetical protein